MFPETVTVTGTDTETGQWITLNPGQRYNVTFIFSFEDGVTGALKLQITNSTAQARAEGTAIIDDLDVVDAEGNVSPIDVDSTADPTHNIHLREITGGAVRWSYTNATGTDKTLQVETVVARV
jgi:hypothetical protein